MGAAARRVTIAGLRAEIARKFGDATRPRDPARGPVVPSGWEAVDRALAGGGLGPGETAILEGEPGGGALGLAASWAREAAARGEPVMVLDAHGTSSAHAWVEPPGAAAIWVVFPPTPPALWPAADIALRSGAFGLVVLLEPPSPPPGAGARLVGLARDRGARLVVTGAAPFAPTARVKLRARGIRWDDAPTGSAPAERALEARCGPGVGTEGPCTEVRRDDHRTDRLRPAARAADRRPPSPRRGAAERAAGRSGR